ncbi:putative DREV methyltransferase [Tieghemostelium lacteum]|uniref:Putative DREV methyltransferase n=1 Tax=Tieghemostelium lacteum TaxID=361077 RepID=A0A151ZGJ8_TIELA|nr:putative DREV methyltransferase [Tieghemostelium lacteum]|eukprot:KYQ93093.1 putative DREV methyltransferase [Tieghemostelium lacteum]
MKSLRNLAVDIIKEEELQNNPHYKLKLYNKTKKEYTFYYRIDRDVLVTEIQDKFVQMEFDQETMKFINETPRWNQISNSMNWLMSWMYTKTDIMGYLNMGKMYILSTSQFKHMLFRMEPQQQQSSEPQQQIVKYESLLDIGSGCGEITLRLMPLFHNTLATEASRGMINSLKRKSINSLYCTDLNHCRELKEKQFSVVSLLNVLDRCEKPLTLLKDIKNYLQPGKGKLLLAVVYPFEPYVEFGGIENEPLETLDINNDSTEEFINSLYKNVLSPLELEIESFTVAPYISEGDTVYKNYALQDIVLVLKHSNNITPIVSNNNINNNNEESVNINIVN